MTWRDRAVVSGADRADWLDARRLRIGASDAAKFSRIESAGLYVKSKLAPGFGGNESSRNGHNWEPAILASAGFHQNTALIHHPDQERFVCTPDGYREDRGALLLAEVKTRNNLITEGPKLSEMRQMAFQLHVIPEAESVTFLWGEIIRDSAAPDGWRLRRSPQSRVFARDDADIVRATATILPIADRVLELLDAALTVRTPF
jgi:hypothetical protein